MTHKVYWYVVTDAQGERSADVCSDPSDWVCLRGTDVNGKYQQFDSCEAYHLHKWASDHGFKLESGVLAIELPVAK